MRQSVACIWFALMGCGPSLQDIHDGVAEDAVKQYEIAKTSGGSKTDLCVQAGLVTAAYLQAQDTANYTKWKSVQAADCAAAGVPIG